jgi:pimeloyl-ACP methyl ester carboxylesterase
MASPVATTGTAESLGGFQLPGAQTDSVKLGELRMVYHRAGNGPAALLLHGLLGYSFSWRFNSEALSKYRTIYAVDMVGAGYSSRVHGLDCRLRAHAQRLLQFIDTMGIESVDLIGNSHGGAVAMMTAALAAEAGHPRVRSLALANPVHPWAKFATLQSTMIGNDRIRNVFGRVLFRHEFLQRWFLKRLYGDRNRIAPGTLEGYTRPFALPGSLEYADSIVRTWWSDLEELKQAMPRIADIPTLLVWGTKDHAVKVESAADLLRAFHDGRLITLKGAGHMPMEEVPEAFNLALIKFLQNGNGAGS